MPLYEYHCSGCGDDFEKMVRFSEVNLTPSCPTCQSQDTKKKISNVSSFGNSHKTVNATSNSNCAPRRGFG